MNLIFIALLHVLSSSFSGEPHV